MQQRDVVTTQRIVLAGGGTAGHVTPLLAVLSALQRRLPKLSASWVGSDRIESRLVPAAGIAFRRIDIRFSYRRLTLANLGYFREHILPLLMGHPFRQGLAAIDAQQPQLVLATGGYVAAPVIWAALHRGISVALIEINDPPGLVNWFFAPRVWRVYAATDMIAAMFAARCSPRKVCVPGYPAMQPQRTRARVCLDYGLDPARRLLVATGGSLGAGAIHHAVQELLSAAAHDGDPRWSKLAVLSIAGERTGLRSGFGVEESLHDSPVQYITLDYIDDVPGVLAASDFYLGRSGAATVGELVACGLPALLIPDPQHGDRQQYGNARVLLKRGQGMLLEQGKVTGATILDWLRGVWDRPKLTPPIPPAADRIADDLLTAWEDA